MSFSPDISAKFNEYKEAYQTFLIQIYQQDFSKKTDTPTLIKTKKAFLTAKKNLEKILPNDISIEDLELQNTTWITSSETKKPTISKSRILGHRDAMCFAKSSNNETKQEKTRIQKPRTRGHRNAMKFKTPPTFEAYESL